jgi:3-oxoacyl-[acyl-carrier-protein] synthase-1
MINQRWQEDGIYVLSVGAQTPIGRSALKSAAAVRCGISAYREHPFMIDRYGEPMVVAMADWLPEAFSAQERIVRLGVDALQEAFTAASTISARQTLTVMIALSTTTLPAEEGQAKVVQRIRTELQQAGFVINPRFVAEGNAIGVAAIQQAAAFLLRGTTDAVAVLGVDSHLGPEQLDAIDDAGRLHSVNNSWGFTPGEGAGAVILTTGRILQHHHLVPLAQLAAVATGSESKLLGTKAVCIGEGLTQAFRGALSESDKVHHSYCDLNGETYRADEFGFAVCRTGEGFHDAGSFVAAAECWGDVGTASVPLQVSLSTSAWSRGFARGSNVLCWSSSTTASLRGALRLTNTWQHGGAT